MVDLSTGGGKAAEEDTDGVKKWTLERPDRQALCDLVPDSKGGSGVVISNPDETSGGSGRMALAALGFATFVVGTAELLVVGVLNVIARDVGVSVSVAGGLVTGYAVGISLGGPLLTAGTIHLERRWLLRLSLLAYLGGNLAAVASPDFAMLLASRIVTGSVHGLFVGVAFAVAPTLVSRKNQGQAMSVITGGITLAMVVGVPLGTLAGQVFTWRVAFSGVVLLGMVALGLVVVLVPPVAPRGIGSFGTQARAAFRPRVLTLLGVGLVLMGGQFAAFTYLEPYLERVTGISGGAVSMFLLVYGLAAAVGTFLGGRAADHSATRTLIVGNAGVVLALAVLFLVGSAPALVAVALFAWAVVGFGLVPALQLRVMSLAGDGADLAATLGVSAVNVGIAGGALAGGAVLAISGVHMVVLVAAMVCAAVFPATWATQQLRPSERATEDVKASLRTPARVIED